MQYSPHAQTALDGTGAGRSIELSIEADNTDTGTLVAHGDPGIPALPYSITVNTGSVSFVGDSTTLATIALPNVSGTAATYVIAWSTEPNPATTGASDALRSVMLVYDVDGDELDFEVVLHAVYAADATDDLYVATDYTNDLNSIRISARYHTPTETREHFVTQSAEPTVDGIEACELPVPADSEFEPGEIVGPQQQAAAASLAIGANRHRLVGPVIQLIWQAGLAWQDPLSDVSSPGQVRAVGDGHTAPLSLVWSRKIPKTCDWLRCEIQWWTYSVFAALVDVSVRIYCAAAPPAQAVEWSAVTLTRTTDDTSSGLGVLESFARLRVHRDVEGRSWIWVAFTIDANNFAALRSLTITPMSMPSSEAQPPNQWGP